MNNQQKILFLKYWAERFPNTDISANLVKHINNNSTSEYIRRFKDIYPERCDLILDVIDASHKLNVGDIG